MGTCSWELLHGDLFMGTCSWGLVHGDLFMGTCSWGKSLLTVRPSQSAHAPFESEASQARAKVLYPQRSGKVREVI